MNSFSILKSRQLGLFAAAGALLLALILPSIVSAAQLTERSIALSSSSVSATNVSYTVNFKPAGDAEAFVVDFCANTPLIGETCATPTGFSASAAAGTGVVAKDVNTLVITKSLVNGTPATQIITGINNPTLVGTMYARIVTYDTALNANDYLSEQAASEDTDRVDEGGAAISITNSIGVSGAVLESLTFCVSGQNNIGAGCVATSGSLTAPTLKLGEAVGDQFALTPGTVSSGSIYTQLSTNASSGAVVSLKSSTIGCGGLLRFGADPATQCDIKPAVTGDVTTASAKFGVKTSDATGVGAGANGTLVPSAGYSNATYALNWLIGDATGVTSTYGDPFLNTASKPANNQNMTLTFGASVTNDTPAGLYSADLSLIATGKF